MYAYPLFPKRNTHSLDGFWDFAFLGENVPELPGLSVEKIVFNEVMAVPGCFDAAPKYAGIRGVGAYRTQIAVTPHARMRLTFHAIGLAARVFLNGKEILYTRCPWSKQSAAFETDSAETAELIVLIDNRIWQPGATVLFQPNYDFYGYGGIYRSVELETLPQSNWFERARAEVLSLDGKVRITGMLHGGKAALSAAFDGADVQAVNAQWNGEEFTFETTVPDPVLWEPEKPVLHTLTLKNDSDTLVEQFGLRTVECAKGQILLNGKPVRLAGYNRHDAHPQFGPAVPDELWIEDLQILKDMNCNFIRGCHYPQSQRFLDLCDKLGFLVWEESLGWGNRNNTVTDPVFRKLQVEQTQNMVKNSINHPSVVMWGFMNESNDNEETGASLLRELAQSVRAIDRSRPVTNATMFIRKSLVLKEFDIISFNIYPGWYEAEIPSNPRPLERIPEVLDEIIAKLDAEGFKDVPLIISEIGAGAMYGCHDRVRGYWSEEYQADHLETVAEYFRTHCRLSGLALWQFCDARTYAATTGVTNRPRTFNNKGTLDEYRRPKMAYDRVKAEFGKLSNKQ